MPTLALFGTTFNLKPGNNPGLKIDAGTASITLDTANRQIEIVVDGVVANVDLHLSWKGAYGGNAQIRLLDAPPPVASIQGDLQLDGETVLLGGAKVRLSADPDIGLEIVDPQATAFNWLQGRLPFAFKFNFATSEIGITLDVRTTPSTAVHRPGGDGGPRMAVVDNFQHDTDSGNSFAVAQELALNVLRVAGRSVKIAASPVKGTLFLHADILDTSTTSDSESPFLFQYALANGQVRIDSENQVTAAVWVSAGKKPAILLLRYQDEHGHPLVFLPDGETPLTVREGVDQSVSKSTRIEDWNFTNRALVIGSHDKSKSLTLAGKLARLNAAEVFAAFADPSRDKNSFSDPWFVKSGEVHIEEAAPAEILGLSRGARLSQQKAQRIATLNVAPVLTKTGAVAFFHSELQLADAGEWTLKALREERDYKPAADKSPKLVGAYEQTGKTGPFALPAIDLAYAVSNLAGEARVNTDGARLGAGPLLAAARDRLATLENQMSGEHPTHFALPKLDSQHHVDGARLFPAQQQAFFRLLDDLPTRAAAVENVARTGSQLKRVLAAPSPPALTSAHAASVGLVSATQSSDLVFGGKEGALADLKKAADDSLGSSGAAFKFFEREWRKLAQDNRVLELRRKLAIEIRPADLLDDQGQPDFERAGVLLEDAIDYVSSSDNLDDITDDALALKAYLEGLAPDDFIGDWKTPTPGLLLLFEHLWCPANFDLLRRIARFISEPAQGFTDLVPRLLGAVPVSSILNALDDPAEGLLQAINQGVDQLWQSAQEIWRVSAEPELIALRAKYGPLLTLDVYRRLLEDDARRDAAVLVGLLNDFLGISLPDLAHLVTEPPDFVFRTKRFAVSQAVKEPLVDAIWNQCFNLCAFADKAWSLFLDDEASILIKLSRKRSLDDLLREVVDSYRTPDRPDPLGIAADPKPNEPEPDPDTIFKNFIKDLDPDILKPDWVGVLFIRPVADIHDDVVLRDLAGFDHISAWWVAVGGQLPQVSVSKAPSIDVWAHILREKQDGPLLPLDPAPIADVHLALTKFDVRIRQTQLSDANIEVIIEPKDVWGQNKASFDPVVLHGAMQAPAGNPNAPKDLVFTAFFPQPKVIPINLAFVKQLELRSLRVARRQGATGIDIDCVLTLTNLTNGLDLSVDIDGSDIKLSLQNFRILLPTLSGVKVPVGTRRKLAFDYPSASFALPRPRAFNVFGVELIPTGLGYIRSNDTNVLKQFKDRYLWLGRLDISGHDPNDFLPYLELDVDFGKNPSFGLIDARGLRFRMALALHVRNARAIAAYVGISGLDAKDLTLDIFGFLKLQMKTLRISQAKLLQGNEPEGPHPVDAGAILAEKIDLHILGWSPLPEGSELDLLMLHPTRAADSNPGRSKGLLAYYANDNPTGFFKLWWLILAHNLELPAKALNYLLDKGPGSTPPAGLLGKLLEKPPELPNKPRENLLFRDVKILERESWLFGMSFGLDGLFDRCSFVLHDQHYYGIHLAADWVKVVFNQESIELAYIPGPTRSQDRFRTNLRIPALDFLGTLKSGEVALEWAVNWDFLVDVGFPWRTSIGYDWFRSFSIPVGCYEAKFGFYVEKRTSTFPSDEFIELGAGLGFYLGYYFGAGNSVAWVRAGIGVFAIIQGSITFRKPASSDPLSILRSSIYAIEVTGVIGVLAYGEGGVDVWVLSARFRVSAQASVACTIRYISGGPCALTYTTSMSAGYSASVRIGCGFCSWTFSVSGEVGMSVSGQLLLS